MVITKQTVLHKVFGRGSAECIDGAYLSVRFACGEKRFVFPDAFAQFLRFEDGQAQEEVEEMLENQRLQRRQQSEAIAGQILEQERRQQQALAQAEEALLPEELAEADDYGDYAYADEYSTIFDWRTLGLKSLSKHE
jgi:hypothetical protein